MTLDKVQYRTIDATPAKIDARARTVTYVLSDESVARDGNTISTAGWQLDNFTANPVFLWAHDASAPPIGRVTSITRSGARLLGTVEYADAETYGFADTVFRLVKGGYLNAVSVSWMPLPGGWKYTTDSKRPGGIDFTKQELLEVSQVPVPALPSALATARAAGIDTTEIMRWADKITRQRRIAEAREIKARDQRIAEAHQLREHARKA